MLDTVYLILLVGGLVSILCGASSALFPKVSILWERRLYRKLRLISENRLTAPVKRGKIIRERLLGCMFLIFGIALISQLPIRLLLGSGNGTEPKDQVRAVSTSEQLIALVKECPAEIGFFGKNLSTGKTVEYRPDQPACLASIVKIFVLLEVMRQADQGTLDLSESITIQRKDKQEICTISEAIDKMIGPSDNEATNALAARVGYDRVNALPEQLDITGLSKKILPEPGVLEKILDKRVFGKRVLSADSLLPQHGTARAIVKYFQLLHDKKLINNKISDAVLEVLNKHPKPFAPARPVQFYSVGKGGSIVWERLIRPQYNMGGWGLYLHSRSTATAFCLWFEWFPRNMSESRRQQWYDAISNSIVQLLLGDTNKEATVSAIPSFASAVALVESQAGIDAWDSLVKNRDTTSFVESVESACVSQTASFATEVIPMVICQDVPTKAHFTWRWRSPDGVYKGTEIEFGRGSLWGWLPVVRLDQEGSWYFEIGCNGKKILDQRVLVKRQNK